MTFTPAEPTPCLLDMRWITLDPIGNQQAAKICRTCPALDACKLDRADKIRNDPDFAEFEGVMAGEIHDPQIKQRARESAARIDDPRSPATLADNCGTKAGRRGHRRRNEIPCEPCLDAEAVYKREWRAQRKGQADVA